MIETFKHTVLPIIIQMVAIVLNKTIILQLTLNLILNGQMPALNAYKQNKSYTGAQALFKTIGKLIFGGMHEI